MAEQLPIRQLEMTERILKELRIPKYLRLQYPKVTPTGAKERVNEYAELLKILLQAMRESLK